MSGAKGNVETISLQWVRIASLATLIPGASAGVTKTKVNFAMQDKPPLNQMEPSMNVGTAIIIGHIAVSIPVLAIMFGLMFVGFVFFRNINWFIFLFLGFILAWTWWSFMIPRWRIWAHRQGVDPEQLQKWAVLTGLVWPKGWIFEKTEFKVKDDE